MRPDVRSKKWPNPVRKVRLQIEEDQGREVTGSELGGSKDFLLWNLLKSTLLIEMGTHNNNSCVRCTG